MQIGTILCFYGTETWPISRWAYVKMRERTCTSLCWLRNLVPASPAPSHVPQISGGWRGPRLGTGPSQQGTCIRPRGWMILQGKWGLHFRRGMNGCWAVKEPVYPCYPSEIPSGSTFPRSLTVTRFSPGLFPHTLWYVPGASVNSFYRASKFDVCRFL